MKALLFQLSRYGLVGIVNVAIGFAVIAILTYSHVSPLLANAGGYAAGLTTSFFLNRGFTFGAGKRTGTFLPFLLSFIVCYLANLAALYTSLPLARIQPLLPQLIGMLTYNVLFFVLMRQWVFARGSGLTRR